MTEQDIIKTDNYLLVLSNKHEHEGWAYHPKWKKVYYLSSRITEPIRKVIGHLPLNGSPLLSGVNLLPPLEGERIPAKFNFVVSHYRIGKEITPVFSEEYIKGRQAVWTGNYIY